MNQNDNQSRQSQIKNHWSTNTTQQALKHVKPYTCKKKYLQSNNPAHLFLANSSRVVERK